MSKIEKQHRFKRSWIQKGFESFSQGRFRSGGANLYVNARGEMEMIHRTDVNNDGHVDIILPNTHGYIARGPDGAGSFYEHSGQEIRRVDAGAAWLQYQALFISPDGCRSAKLREVRIDLPAVGAGPVGGPR